jgi:hypothetical protein
VAKFETISLNSPILATFVPLVEQSSTAMLFCAFLKPSSVINSRKTCLSSYQNDV